MRGAKCIVHIKSVTERRELLGEGRVVLFFFWMKTEIFKQDNIAIPGDIRGARCWFADTIIGKRDRLLQ
jgi:hypothetical protein